MRQVKKMPMTKITDPGNNIWEFKYDIMGNAIEMIYPDGSKIKQGFDTAGRLKTFTNKRNQSIHYSYNRNRCKVNNPQGESSGIRYKSSGLSGKQ
jgi:YD repeat-containing protein